MIQWLTTGINPQAISRPYDGQQRGWALHAVESNDKQTLEEIRYYRAACGLLPRHGWGLDFWIESRCKRCEMAIAKAVKRAMCPDETAGVA